MTRAGIKIKKQGEEDLYFYSHCNGYPTCLLVDIIHMKDKDNYDKVVQNMRNNYEEIYNYPGDIEYSYVIDFDENKVYTYSDRECHLLRIDLLDTDVIEIEK